ncbi:MAG TPA: hypothetical protein VF046_10045 [Gemmatimonadales bacterium]
MFVSPRSTRRILTLLPFLFSLTACGPKPPRKQLDKHGKSVASWAATAEMVATAWLRGDVPTDYARQTLQSGAKQVERARSSLAQVAAGDSLAEAAVEAYGRLADRLTRMTAALQQNDRSAVEQSTDRLPSEAQRIRALRGHVRPGA